jgi:phosphoribosyl-ATP pyrophosphohydrolase
LAKPSASPPKAKAKPGTAKLKAKHLLTDTQAAPRRPKVGRARSKTGGSGDALERLLDAVQEVREGRRTSPRTARLLAAGAPKMAQKVVEEAAEVAIEAVQGRREALINESVDLLYNLAVLWTGVGVTLDDLWGEMNRREATLGMAEKLPKADDV